MVAALAARRPRYCGTDRPASIGSAFSKMNRVGQGLYWMNAGDENVHGVKVDGFISGAYGYKLPIIVKREWGTYQSAGRQLGGAMFILDMDYIKRRPLRNRDTKLLPNRQLPGQDRVVFDYLTETSLQLQNEAAHGVIYGFAAV